MIKHFFLITVLTGIHLLFSLLLSDSLERYINPDMLLLFCFLISINTKISNTFYFLDIFFIVLIVRVLSGEPLGIALIYYTTISFILESVKGIIIRNVYFLTLFFLIALALKIGIFFLVAQVASYAYYYNLLLRIELLYHVLGSLVAFILLYLVFRTKIIRIRL